MDDIKINLKYTQTIFTINSVCVYLKLFVLLIE